MFETTDQTHPRIEALPMDTIGALATKVLVGQRSHEAKILGRRPDAAPGARTKSVCTCERNDG